MHQKFGELDLWMLISFIILFMIVFYRENHVRACLHLITFSLKNFSSETIDWIFTEFHEIKWILKIK